MSGRFALHEGDCREVMRGMADASVDSIVCDPPYHLTTGKKGGSGPASVNLESPYGRARIGTGFMGMTWDGGDVAFDAATWREALRVAKPGAYMAVFGGTRTFHRVTCAVEDAGWELRETGVRGHTPEDCPWLFGWMHGEGFPKGTDKAKIPEPWRSDGWNTALKPAWEPIIIARKPMVGTLAENLEAVGTGAMNINGCRIAVADESYARNCSGDRGQDGTRDADAEGATNMRMGGGSASALGRWPANLIHDGSPEVVSLFPREAGAAAPVTVRNGDKFRGVYGAFGGNIDEQGSAFHGDTGSAARFFYCAKTAREDRDEGLGPEFAKRDLNWSSGEQNPGSFHSPNTDRSARNFHPTVKPTALMRWVVRLLTPRGGVTLDPFMGSGSTGKAAMLEGLRFVGIDLSPEYIAIARARIEFALRQGFQESLM